MSGGTTRVKLNSWCQEHALNMCVHAIGTQCPTVESRGFLPLAQTTLALAENIKPRLQHDEWHALVDIASSQWGPGISNHLYYHVVRYSEMLALRQEGKMPRGLAATVLPYCAAQKALLWQKRSATSHLFPGYLSLLGGGFNPSVAGNVGDHNCPRLTASREAFEESALQLVIAEDTLVTITQETDNGAMQINFLGVPADFSQAKANETEGLLVELPEPSLAQVPALTGFTHLAKANLAAWLAYKENMTT